MEEEEVESFIESEEESILQNYVSESEDMDEGNEKYNSDYWLRENKFKFFKFVFLQFLLDIKEKSLVLLEI